MKPGQDGEVAEVEDRRAVRDPVGRGPDAAHPSVVVDVDDAIDEDLARLDVEQPPDADGGRHARIRPTRSGRTAARAGCAPVGGGR